METQLDEEENTVSLGPYKPKTEEQPPRISPSPKSAQTASYREPSLPPEEERLRKIEARLSKLESVADPYPESSPISPIAPIRSSVKVSFPPTFGIKLTLGLCVLALFSSATLLFK